MKLKIRDIGGGLGIILPPRLLARLGVKQGDSIYLVETPTGFQLTADKHAAEVLAAESRVVRKYRNALQRLADS